MEAGASGRSYLYLSSPIGVSLDEEPGNFILASRSKADGWTARYIGETEDLASLTQEARGRFAEVGQLNGTLVHFRSNRLGRAARVEEMMDLIAHWQPPGNDEPSTNPRLVMRASSPYRR